MAKDNQILVRVNDPTNDAIESFAEKHDYTKAEAARRMIEDRLAGEGHLEGGRAVPDGGQILDRINAIDQQQTQRLDEIEQEIGSLNRKPSRLERITDQAHKWSFGFTMVGSIIGLLVGVGLITSINSDLVAGFTLISGIIFVISNFIRETLYDKQGLSE